MSELSLGIIEIVGLAAAIEAADICLKTANVSLVGYELTKGDGMAVIKIEGNVGAVKAAIEAAKISAMKVNKVVSFKIIPRPSEQIKLLIRNNDTVGYENKIECIDDLEESKSLESIEDTCVIKTDKETVIEDKIILLEESKIDTASVFLKNVADEKKKL